MEQESLITISEACRILGVSEAALRQWTDEGKVKAFVTPGGHRRYSMRELKRIISTPQKILGMKDLAGMLEDTAQVHREASIGFLQGTSSYSQLNSETQERLASLSRQLYRTIVSYVTRPARRDEAVEQAKISGGDFGEFLAKLGLPLTESVRAFVLHRGPVQNVAVKMMRRRDAKTEKIAEAIPMVDTVMDEALVAMVMAYERIKGLQQTNTQ